MRWFTIHGKIIIALVLCFYILGCTGYKKYQLSGDENWAQISQKEKGPIQVGKFIKVQTADGQKMHGTVDSVNEFDFILDGKQVNYISIEFVQVHELLWVPTITLGAASVFTWLVLTVETGKFSTD